MLWPGSGTADQLVGMKRRKVFSFRGISSSYFVQRSGNRRNAHGKLSIYGSEEPPLLMLKSAVGRSRSGGGETDEGSLRQEKSTHLWDRVLWEVLRGGMALGVGRLGGGGNE